MNLGKFIQQLHGKGIQLFLRDGGSGFKAAKGALTPEIKQQLTEHKVAIIELLKAAAATNTRQPLIEPLVDRSRIPLSFAQQRLWFIDKFEGQNAHYNIGYALKLAGVLDVAVLSQVFSTIIERHQSLRTVFAWVDNEPEQQVVEAVEFELTLADLSDLDPESQTSALTTLSQQQASTGFDLSQDLMLRVNLVKLAATSHILILTMHHIASDGWSVGLLIKEVSELYRAFVAGQPDPLPPLAIQYADYAAWQRQWLVGDTLAEGLNYWRGQLQGLPQVHNLALDHSRQAHSAPSGLTYNSRLDQPLTTRLKAVGREQNATLFMTLQTAFAVLIGRYSRETDIVLGTPIANRNEAEVKSLIGLFINTLVLRNDLANNPTFAQQLQRTRTMTLDAFTYQYIPFEMLVEELQPERSLYHSPLFQVMFVLQNNESQTLQLPGLTLSPVAQESSAVKFDLTLTMTEDEQGLEVNWEYNRDIFSAATIAAMDTHFKVMLAHIAAAPQTPIQQLALLSEQEQHDLISTLNQTATDYPADSCIHQLFEAQVARTPAATAVVFADQALSYQQLNQRANQLAWHLMAQGVKPNTLVALCVERSLDMLVGLLAILKAGGAYVPMDPSYPQARLSHILNDSGAPFLLTQTDIIPMLAIGPNTHSLCIDSFAWPATDDPIANATSQVTAADLAYMIYTSGSTGLPKGVRIHHRNVMNFFAGLDQAVTAPTKPATWLAVTSISFDISVLELFWTLANGAKVVIQPDRPVLTSSQKAMDFGLFYFAAQEQQSKNNKYNLLLKGAKFADQHQLTSVWVPERHFASFGDQFPNPSVAAAAVAATTKNIKIRSGSVVLPLHDPIRVAEEWSMVDNLSNGRVEVSVAAGWHPNDFVFAPADYDQRHRHIREKLAIVHDLWVGKTITRTNGVGHDFAVKIHPKPVQATLPTWITAAGAPDTFRYAGSIGANVLTHLLGQSIEEVGEKITLYRQSLVEAGYPADHGTVALMLHSFVSDDADSVKAIVEQPFKNYLRHSINLIGPLAKDAGLDIENDIEAIIDMGFARFYHTSALFGTPESCLAQIDNLLALGVDEIACLIDFGIDDDITLANLPHLVKLQQLSRQKAAQQQLLAKRLDQVWSPTNLARQHQVSHLQCTPAYVRDWVSDSDGQAVLAQLDTLMVGGEAMPDDLAGGLLEYLGGRLYNMYGPTETTVWSAVKPITSQRVTLGPPLANTQFYVVDDALQLVPKGVPGELCIGGAGVSSGYHQRELLSAERFVVDPFAGNGEQKIYRTGDLVRHLPEGGLAFLGRIDDQVKIRGFRIELGEIEQQLIALPFIQAAIVTASADASGSKRLVGYVIADPTLPMSEVDLIVKAKSKLQMLLPEYMVPAFLVVLSQWPLTPNGKINKLALPPPQFEIDSQHYVEPVGETQVQLASIWADLLQMPVGQVSAEAGFFELGGHSLLSLRLVVEVRDHFAVELSIRDIFEAPQLAALASKIDQLCAHEHSKLRHQALTTNTKKKVRILL